MEPLLYPQRQKKLQTLLDRLGLPKSASINWKLLDQALTHPSADGRHNYEQIEFLGDAVIRLAAAEFLLQTYPNMPVGEFSAIRSILVSDRMLARIGETYNLERYLILSNSARNDHTGRESRLADAMEAVLGALYLSTNTLELIRPWIAGHLHQLTQEIRSDPARQNYKAALQEWTQAHYNSLPEYRVKEMDPTQGSSERFEAEVWFQEQVWGRGTGRSRKIAEQTAAQVAFLTIQQMGVSF